MILIVLILIFFSIHLIIFFFFSLTKRNTYTRNDINLKKVIIRLLAIERG
jgi:hypothetical protein